MSPPQVILVDEKDQQTGTMEKLEAHRKGLLHRAFSVFIFNNKGEMLLQKRASEKYHSGGLWSNACCSHPTPGEETVVAAMRRLHEEMGFSCDLREAGSILYRVDFEDGLVEHEFDHLFVGYYSGSVSVNSLEVSEYRFSPLTLIEQQLTSDENQFSYWFRIAYPKIAEFLQREVFR